MALMLHHHARRTLAELSALSGAPDQGAYRAQLEKLVALYPDFASGWEALAHSYVAAGQRALAVDCHRRAVSAEPLNPARHLALARFLWEQAEDLPAATEAIKQALALAPHHWEAWALFTRLNMEAGRLHQALDGAYRLYALLGPPGSEPVDHRAERLVAEALDLARRAISAQNASVARHALLDIVLGCDPAQAEAWALLKDLDRTWPRPSGQAPWVSVLVSVYKAERFLRGCLEDLERQTIADQLEIIVVDSASPQNERAIVEEFQRRYGNIIYLRTEQRETVYATWNRAIRLARGRYLTNANADDRHRRDALEVLARTLDAHPEVALVYADCLITRTENETFETAHPVGCYRWLDFDRRALLEKGCFVGPQPMWRREVHDEHGLFDPEFVSAGDYEFWLRIARTRTFLHVRETLGLYLDSPTSVEHANQDRARREVEIARARYAREVLAQADRAGLVSPGLSLVPGQRAKTRADLGPSTAVPAAPSAPQGGEAHVAQVGSRAVGHSAAPAGTSATEPQTPIASGDQPSPIGSPPTPNLRSHHRRPLPPVAAVGQLDEAKSHFGRKDLQTAWAATITALKARPFHPEAWLLLARIAEAASDLAKARACAERAQALAPAWQPPKRFLKSLRPRKGVARAELPPLPPALTPRSPRLTVCLIARNEERFIGQCLESVRPVADQIVVVDTGSTDWTKQIAGRFGAEVYDFPWCDDFSAARNAALEHATGDWILMIDADEQLRPDSLATLKQELNDPQVMAYRLPIFDVGREQEGCSYVPRLFRNAPGLFYVGRVHEQVYSTLEVRRAEWGLDNRLGRTTLLHHGYSPELTRQRQKVQRNLALLHRALAEMPDEPNLLMNYGLELIRSGQKEAGLRQYEAAFQRLSRLPPAQVVPELRETLLTQFASHLLGARQFERVVQVLESPLARAGGLTASMHFALGLALMELGQYQRASEQMRQCLATRDAPTLSPINPEIHKAGPHHCLALCLQRLNQTEAAAQAFAAAQAADPASGPLLRDYALFLAQTGQSVEGLKLLHRLIGEDPTEPATWLAGGQIALSRPDFIEFACDWTGEALKYCPNVPELIAQRVQALLLHQDVAQAAELLRGLPPPVPAELQAALVLCELVQGSPWSPLSAPEPLVSREFVAWYRALLDYRAEGLLGLVHSRLNRLAEVLPTASHLLEQALAEAAQPVAV